MTKTHFGDPCIHCGIAQEDVAPGACLGSGKPIPIAYAGLGVRPDGVEDFRIRYSDGSIARQSWHISEHAPYYHFGTRDAITQPPRYDERLRP
jgi:hypothetical protein